ncbi:LysR substrate-binding domain-containing protein [Rhodoferax sp. TBRC 17660]|uniref:LysR substrate-binding domain-containing protein n=1 Tax=Rhodoferax potami TaxID=3068338 RepID=A0ABU3KM36_9BURK|nr:LysR substrate-binding domain-containing protein [Rhodoferax sp. TBRC 17660]MDT7518508.1 LysR substrate-binding domain-containing protein [Rhodoferax sp. TBRC 17660]
MASARAAWVCPQYLIANSASPSLNRWNRAEGTTTEALTVLNLVRYGVGIARLNDLMAAPLVRSGELVPLLQTHFGGGRVPIFAVMLQKRHRLPKVRTCLDYRAEWIAGMS